MSPILADETSSDSEDENGREVTKDLAAGTLSLLLAIGLAAVHFGQTGRLHDDYGREPGPAFLPEILLAVLALIGAAMLLRGLVMLIKRRPKHAITTQSNFGDLATPGIMATLLIAFLALQGHIGFGMALAGLGAAVTFVLAKQESGRSLFAVFEGLLIAGFCYALFRFVLSVPLT